MYFKTKSNSKLKDITGITYLSNIEEDGKVFKYGTIEEKDLLKYLETWESFYLPGRFQKTNLPIIESNKIKKANELNRKNALYTALLTLKEKDNKLIDIYTQICGLSYLGDTRMKFAENPRKVLNIVEGSYDKFKEIYGTGNEYFKVDKKENIKINYDILLKDINNLPKSLYEYIEEVVKTGDIDLIREKILEYFTNLNKKESTKQTIKGLFTNGIVRSIRYAYQKVLKKIKK
jgi:translocator assembly and maintenance protein 41